MKYREYRINEMKSLQEWVKKVLTIAGAEKNNNELNRLSEHLLDDLGFDEKGQPLQWSSFLPKKTKASCIGLSLRKAGACLQNQQILSKNCCP